ncbi:MAG: type II toxin-antitoxin system prevent-host-death family antitoxin [Alphaproteobacteria bacterium]|nr:type II toxin-antitoxin system prevent-host-death family antitoxin [Alphaproteobacteria bacterium]
MKELSLRDANQQFSKIVRDVAESGEEVVVLRNGKATVKIVPFEEKGKRKLTPAQNAALNGFLEFARASTAKSVGPWTREELYER